MMKTYIVMDYDVIAYAGNNKKEAQKHQTTIWVWKGGKQIGYMDYDSFKRVWKEFFYKPA